MFTEEAANLDRTPWSLNMRGCQTICMAMIVPGFRKAHNNHHFAKQFDVKEINEPWNMDTINRPIIDEVLLAEVYVDSKDRMHCKCHENNFKIKWNSSWFCVPVIYLQ